MQQAQQRAGNAGSKEQARAQARMRQQGSPTRRRAVCSVIALRRVAVQYGMAAGSALQRAGSMPAQPTRPPFIDDRRPPSTPAAARSFLRESACACAVCALRVKTRRHAEVAARLSAFF